MLGLHRIAKRFPNGHEALAGVTLDVAEIGRASCRERVSSPV